MIDRLSLVQTLSSIPQEQLLQIIFTLKPPSGIIPSNSASQGQQVFALLQWADSPSGCELERVQEVLDTVIKPANHNSSSSTQVQPQPNISNTTTTTTNLQEIALKSEKGVNYSKLQQLIEQQKWKEADQETADRMLEAISKNSWWDVEREDIENFPCEDLRTIDQLWVKYSNGKFGFSVQKNIWLEVGGNVDYDTEKKIGDRIGWRKGGEWKSYDSLKFDLSAPPGHLPARCVGAWWWAPVWVGGWGWWVLGVLLSRKEL